MELNVAAISAAAWVLFFGGAALARLYGRRLLGLLAVGAGVIVGVGILVTFGWRGALNLAVAGAIVGIGDLWLARRRPSKGSGAPA